MLGRQRLAGALEVIGSGAKVWAGGGRPRIWQGKGQKNDQQRPRFVEAPPQNRDYTTARHSKGVRSTMFHLCQVSKHTIPGPSASQ